MITINQYVNVSKQRLDDIYFIANIILTDLNLPKITINIESSYVMKQFDADGLCCDETTIDIVNKRSIKELFKVLAHEIRHAFQYFNGFNGDVLKMEKDAYQYENASYNKFKLCF